MWNKWIVSHGNNNLVISYQGVKGITQTGGMIIEQRHSNWFFQAGRITAAGHITLHFLLIIYNNTPPLVPVPYYRRPSRHGSFQDLAATDLKFYLRRETGHALF